MATWFEEDFAGIAPGTPVWTGNNPTGFPFPPNNATYITVEEVRPGVMGVQPRTTGWANLTLPMGGRTTARVGLRVKFNGVVDPTTTAVWGVGWFRDAADTILGDFILRNNTANQGTRYPAHRNNFTYVNPVPSSDLLSPGTILSVEMFYDGPAYSIDMWEGEDTSGPAKYHWQGTLATTPANLLFGPDANTGVSAIMYDFWATDGERREGSDPAVVHWSHNGSSRHDRFLVSARVEGAETVAVEYGTSPDFVGAALSPPSPGALTPEGHHHVEVTGLSPSTAYHWRLVVDGSPTTQTGRTKTLPPPGPPTSMSIVWGSCYWSNASAVFPYITARDPDLVLQVGDDGYTFYSGGDTNPSPGDPYPAPADTALIRSIRDEVFTRAGRRTMTAQFPVEHMYSDTDGLGGNMDSTQSAPENVQEAWRQMYAHYLDDASTGFRTWVVGRFRFIVVDENTASGAKNSPQSPTKSKIGAAQKALLFAALEQAAADRQFVLLFGDGPWLGATDNNLTNTGNGYNKYNDERTQIGQKVQQCIAEGMLGFHRYHGDDHTLYGDSGANNPWGGFPVYCAAPMNEGSNTGTTATYDAGKWPTTAEESGPARQYGVIDITDDGAAITVRSRGFSSTSAEPAEVARFDQTLVYAPEPAQVDASAGIARAAVAVIEAPAIPPARVEAAAIVVRSAAAVVQAPAVPPAQVSASTGVVRSAAASILAPTVPPAQVAASVGRTLGGAAVIAAPNVPPAALEAAAGVTRAALAVVAAPAVLPAQVEASTRIGRSGVAVVSSPSIPAAQVSATVAIVRAARAVVGSAEAGVVLQPIWGPYRGPNPLDRLEIHR